MKTDRPLWVRYGREAVRNAVKPADFAARPPTLWRYRELLPIRGEDSIVTLGEGVTPILPVSNLGAELGLEDLWIKDESQLPTSSFKSRCMALAVTMARPFGLKRPAPPPPGHALGRVPAPSDVTRSAGRRACTPPAGRKRAGGDGGAAPPPKTTQVTRAGTALVTFQPDG